MYEWFKKHLSANTFSFFPTNSFVWFGIKCPLLDLGMLIHHFLFKVLSLCSGFIVKSFCACYLNKILLTELLSFHSFSFFSSHKKTLTLKTSVDQVLKTN